MQYICIYQNLLIDITAPLFILVLLELAFRQILDIFLLVALKK